MTINTMHFEKFLPAKAKFMTNMLAGVRSSFVLEKIWSTK